MIDLSVAPKRVQELWEDGLDMDDVSADALLAGIELHVYREYDIDDTMILEFFHRESKTRWLARYSGFDAETVEVFGVVNQWEK